MGFTSSKLGGPPPVDRDLRSAAERAAEAASKVPNPKPEPGAPKRVKRKSVSWANDSLLQSVRLFSLVRCSLYNCMGPVMFQYGPASLGNLPGQILTLLSTEGKELLWLMFQVIAVRLPTNHR